MKKYEYKIIHPGELRKNRVTEPGPDVLEAFLNNMGDGGWKYKSVIVHGNDTHFLFEREVEEVVFTPNDKKPWEGDRPSE